VDIVVEAIGGEMPALDYLRRAITSGKHVVTSNKEVIAKHGSELQALAQQHEVGVDYEASVGGGIPLIAPFKHDLVANEIRGIYAIINGTTNYILTKMAREGMDFATALKMAQELEKLGCDSICIKDMAGIISLRQQKSLCQQLKRGLRCRLTFTPIAVLAWRP
jgi:homoserine dehydrogenase